MITSNDPQKLSNQLPSTPRFSILRTIIYHNEDNYLHIEDNYFDVEDNYLRIEDNYINIEDNYLHIEDNTKLIFFTFESLPLDLSVEKRSKVMAITV